ncbi:DUF1007 family protein [Marinospirillum insulare]|uniref:DUF1007 family protein n=1 Tax=Marinospirillum insulare TaxID=217169 RepID=A0ABQ5ZXA1_9GAMM|nr:DUF1007 family protein [Marinospirillum insulare]GLR64809.1 hypothetical protein GCM10007878_22470 [Marinospirillum insulare]
MLKFLRQKTSLLTTLVLLTLAGQLNAHPHVWIDLRTKPVINDRGELLGLEQAWRFDPFYSLVLIEELEKGGAAEELEERYDQLAWEIVKNLNSVNFFTQGKAELMASQWAEVTESTLLKVGARIELRFFLPLVEPLLVKEATFSYQVYDPSYYIEMLHAKEGGLDRTGLKPTCELSLEVATPSPDLIQQALALDKTQVADDPQLGKYFAERVNLDCLE